MSKFKVSFNLSLNTLNHPNWIYLSISNQLEDGEQITDYTCDNVESDEPAGIFKIAFNVDLKTDNHPKWIYETVSDQLEDCEEIYGIVYELVE